MAYRQFVYLILLPAMLAGQDAKLSDAARELVDKPRLGRAKITLVDGTAQEGRVKRVTDEFIAFEHYKPLACEDVELSNITAVQWLQSPRQPGARARMADVIFGGAILAPFAGVDAIADAFKGLSPPLKPLRGSWEIRERRGAPTSILEFEGNTVQDRTYRTREGRWSIEQNQLHMVLDGEPESVTPFHFECGELVLDHPAGKLQDAMRRSRASAPIIGIWAGTNFHLRIMPDGTLVEQKWEVRKGTFKSSTTEVKMHWSDSSGLGGSEWIAQIKHHHIVVRIGGVTIVYRYVLPTTMDL